MRTTMRRTIRGTATALGALAIVMGTAGCGSLLGGDDDTRTDEQTQGQEQNGDDTDDSTGDDSSDDDSTGGDPGEANSGEANSDEDAPAEGAESAGGTGDTSGNGLQEGEDEDGTDDGSDDTGSDDTGSDESEDGDDGTGTDAAALSEADLDAASSRFGDFWDAVADGDPDTACRLVVDHDTGKPAEGQGLQACVDSFEEAFGGDEVDPASFAAFDRSMFVAVDNGDGRAEITIMGESSEVYMVRADDGQWYLDGEASF